MTHEIRVHDIEWTPALVSRFWSSYAAHGRRDTTYFSMQVGDSVLRHARRYMRSGGRMLDYGCGPGFLIEKLLQHRFACGGLDFDLQSVRMCLEKFLGHPLFLGAVHANQIPTPLAEGDWDAVFLLETIEHLPMDALDGVLNEVLRILRPLGRVILTTRNQEDLEAGTVVCPECGCRFHRMQHVRSFSAQGLADLLRRHRFRVLECGPTFFRPPSILNPAREAQRLLTRGALPHLFAAAEKMD